MKWLTYIDRALGVIDTVVKWIVGSALLLMTAVVFLNSLARAFYNESFVGGPALGRLLVIWLCFLASYLLVRSNGHVAIDITARFVSDKTFRGMSVVIGVIGAVFMTYVGWLGFVFTSSRFEFGQMDPMLGIETGYFYLPLPIGGFLMAVGFLVGAMKAAFIGVERPAADTGDKGGKE